MPQLNPEFFVSQLFLLAVFFSFLFVFLWRVSLPRIAVVLEKRQNKIDNDLSSAKQLQEEAKKIERDINEKIYKAKQDTDNQIKETISALEKEVSVKLSSLDKELDDKISKSEKEIQKNRDSQLEDINKEILNIAKITISKISKFEFSNKDIEEVIKTSRGNLS